jgi:hypothetical protein
MFTATDWENLMKGYTSQHFEHEYWVEESAIEGVVQLSITWSEA